jgi:hypothetical protein
LVINRGAEDNVFLNDLAGGLVGAEGAFDANGVENGGGYTKYTGSHTDASGNNQLVELLLQSNMTPP